MPGPDPAPVLRRLAGLSDFQLGLTYACGVFPAVLLRVWAEGHNGVTWLNALAAVLALATVSAFVAVVAFYRNEDLVVAGILLAGITGIGTGAAFVVAIAVVTGSPGAAAVLIAGGFFVVVMRIILLAPLMAAAVWVARKFRRYLAPDTVERASDAGRGEAA
jgi:hypothetical protein